MLLKLELLLEERREKGQEKETQKKEEKEGKEIEIFVWDQEAIKKYAEGTAEKCRMEGEKNKEKETVQEKWERIKRIVHGALIKKRIKIKEKEIGQRMVGEEMYKKKEKKGKGIVPVGEEER